jgi:hypothetical protein
MHRMRCRADETDDDLAIVAGAHRIDVCQGHRRGE